MEPMLTHLSTKKTASSEEAANIILALKTLEEIINKQARTISDVASLRRREATSEEEKKRINKWEQDSLHALREHFDPSTFRSENPYLCSEAQERALRAFAKSTAVETWLLSHTFKQMTPAKVAIYASRIRLLISMTIMQTEVWLTSYTPALDLIALECAAIARINHGAEQVSERTYSALNELISSVLLSDTKLIRESNFESTGLAFMEVIVDGHRMDFHEACTQKFIWAASLALSHPEACVLRWMELALGNRATKSQAMQLLRETFKPCGEEEKSIINSAFLKFVKSYAS